MGSITSSVAWPVAIIILAVVGAVTYMVSAGDMSASDASTILVLILGGLGITASAHVTGNLVSAAAVKGSSPAPTGAAPGPAPVGGTTVPPSTPAMPT